MALEDRKRHGEKEREICKPNKEEAEQQRETEGVGEGEVERDEVNLDNIYKAEA